MVGKIGCQVVTLLRRRRRVYVVIVFPEVRVPLIGFTWQEAVISLEALADGPAISRAGRGGVFVGRKVPLAEAECVVALLEEHRGKHRRFLRDLAVITGEAGGKFGNGGNADGMMIAAC